MSNIFELILIKKLPYTMINKCYYVNIWFIIDNKLRLVYKKINIPITKGNKLIYKTNHINLIFYWNNKLTNSKWHTNKSIKTYNQDIYGWIIIIYILKCLVNK